jgi:acetyl-CoA carboxylase biotin carboxyl carrier protein
MNLKEILLLLEKFECSDLSSLKVTLQGDLFEASRTTELKHTTINKVGETPKTSFTTHLSESKPEAPVIPSTDEEINGIEVNAPLVGTFYRSPGEEEEPFVKVGDSVTKGQVLCILEAMKVMNEIKSPCNGILKKVLVKDGEAVDFGKTMFLLEEV